MRKVRSGLRMGRGTEAEVQPANRRAPGSPAAFQPWRDRRGQGHFRGAVQAGLGDLAGVHLEFGDQTGRSGRKTQRARLASIIRCPSLDGQQDRA